MPRPQHSGVIDLRGEVCIVRPSSCLAVGHVVMFVGGSVLQCLRGVVKLLGVRGTLDKLCL